MGGSPGRPRKGRTGRTVLVVAGTRAGRLLAIVVGCSFSIHLAAAPATAVDLSSEYPGNHASRVQAGRVSGVVDTLLRAHQLISRGEHDAAYAAFAAARAAARSEVLVGEEEAKRRGTGEREREGLEGAVWPSGVVEAAVISLHGLSAYKIGRTSEALLLLSQACEADAWSCAELATCLRDTGRLSDSIAVVEAALPRLPAAAVLWLGLGLALSKQAKYSLAASAYLAAYRLDPSNPALLANVGQALVQAGDKQQALTATVSQARVYFKNAYAKMPDNVSLLLILCEFYMGLDDPRQLSAFLNKALQLGSDNHEVLEMYARTLTRVGEYDRALAVRRRIVRMYPQNLLHKCKLLALAQAVAAWDEIEELVPEVLSELRRAGRGTVAAMRECVQPLEATMNPLYTEDDLQFITRMWAGEILWTIPGTRETAQALGEAEWGGAVFLMIQGLWRSHAQSGALRVHTYSTVELVQVSAVMRSVAGGGAGGAGMVESYLELRNYSVVRRLAYPADRIASANSLRADALGVLVNINGWCDAGANELLPARVAPVQMSFMGYPGSMGSSAWTDLLISDAVASPPEWQAHYTEKLLYLPQSYYINDFPFRLPDVGSYRDPPHAGALANLSRAAFGLQDAAFVFVCFSRAEKIDRKLFDAWMAILRQAPDSLLWLLKDTKTKTAAETAVTAHFRAAAAAAGVDPRRLVFAEAVAWEAHVRRGALANLFLDTLAYNAHSTGCNSLWAGVPLLTYAGVKMAARVAASLNRAAHAEVYTARTLDEYVETAVRLARNAPRGELLRQRVMAPEQRRRVPLFDTDAMVRALERGYRMSAEVYAYTLSHMHVLPAAA